MFALGDLDGKIRDGDVVILDGSRGILVTEPDEKQLRYYRQRQKQFAEQQTELKELADFPAVTTDGHQVAIAANIGVVEDVGGVLESGSDGIGLYRTEFLYIGREDLPDEQEQFEAYKAVAQRLNGKPVIIRTLDIGGDKEIESFSHPEEANPFLGWRGIRISLSKPNVFKTQLRAILRASAFGNILVMYPMISGIEEVRQANNILVAAKTELRAEGQPFDDNLKVGVMIEVPSAAVTADIMAPGGRFSSASAPMICANIPWRWTGSTRKSATCISRFIRRYYG